MTPLRCFTGKLINIMTHLCTIYLHLGLEKYSQKQKNNTIKLSTQITCSRSTLLKQSDQNLTYYSLIIFTSSNQTSEQITHCDYVTWIKLDLIQINKDLQINTLDFFNESFDHFSGRFSVNKTVRVSCLKKKNQ